MTSENYTSIILTADEGFYLTQVEDVDILSRVIATKVALSVHSSPEDWKEITEEEAKSFMEEQNEARKNENDKDQGQEP